MSDSAHGAGMAVRREVLGDEHVDRAIDRPAVYAGAPRLTPRLRSPSACSTSALKQSVGRIPKDPPDAEDVVRLRALSAPAADLIPFTAW